MVVHRAEDLVLHARTDTTARRRFGGALRGVTLLAVVAALIVSIAVVVQRPVPIASADPSSGFVDDVPSTTPSSLGDVDLTELEYGDPTEALDIIDPPTAEAADGGASLSHPLTVPPGRAGVEPELALQYSSGGGSSWAGTGWDLSVGAVTVDTEFGAPRYLTALESETYQLDGDRLFPNAIRTVLQSRVAGPRADWVRQTEDDHDLIIRHGSAPDQYCWEVRDTNGNRKFYGGEPDGNGGCTRIESAILTAEPTGVDGGGRGDYHWALTYVVDISGNTMRYSYDELTGVQIGRTGSAAIGVSLYLREVVYTGFDDAAMNRPAYRVRFLRDGDIAADPAPNPSNVARRSDIMVDASTGAPVVTRELLREVTVEYLPAGYYDQPRSEQARLVKGWILEYDVTSPFDKTLLTRVGQYGATAQGAGQPVHAWHDFAWYDEVTDGNGKYRGFAPSEEWGTGNEANRVNIAAESALGTSYRGGADGGAYIGFNPISPSKTGSFGGSFNIAGGLSGEVSTLLDLNGDNLPDKVYLDGNSVLWRPNLRTAEGAVKQGNTWFGPAQPVRLVNGSNALPGGALNSLGTSFDLKVNLQFEAYPIVAIQVGGGFAFSFGDVYFEDVNGDGRVDVVRPGGAGQHTVYFNVLIGGVPTFIDSTLASALSGVLEVPLDAFSASSSNGAVAEVSELLVNTSPRIDTVRRWIAPHRGIVRISGAVSLVAPNDYVGDGVQVSIESGGTQRWATTLDKAASGASPTVDVDVAAGQAIYFRNHVIANASGDQVTWDPTITYTHVGEPPPGAVPPTAAPDANGRDQLVYTASQDFTLFGRTGARTPLDQPGPLTVNVSVTTAPGGLSDDLRVVVRHGRGSDDDNDITNNLKSTTTVLTVPQLTAGTATGATTFTVEAPERAPAVPPATEGPITATDWVMVDVVSDSPVDPTKFSVEITTSAPGAQQPDVSQIPADQRPDIPLDVPIVPNVRVFARTDHVAPYVPVTAPTMENPTTSTLEVAVTGDATPWLGKSVVSDASVTIKTLAGGVVAKAPLTITNGFPTWTGAATVDFVPESGAQYYVDVSVPDPTIGRAVDLASSKLTFRWTQTEQDADGNDVPVARSQEVSDVGQLHWPDVDGVFPSGNRGWAIAGYNADYDGDGAAASDGGPLVEGRFTVRPRNDDGSFDEDTPVPDAQAAPDPEDVTGALATGDGFDPSYPYIPWGESGSDVATMWRAGAKPTLNGTGTTLQSDRLGADVAITGSPTAGRTAPRMLSVSGDFHFLLGLIASFTAAAGGGRALTDFQDYNGDGFPDWRDGSNVDYTGPRGGKAASNSASANPFDLTLALGGGINGSAISASNTTHTPNNDGGGMGSNVEPTSTKSSRGMNLGLGFSVQSSWTNPTSTGNGFGGEIASNDPDAKNVLGPATTKSDPRGTQVDRAFIDVNGDGMPDRVDSYTSGELWVALNLGYRFAEGVLWAEGRTSANQDLAGSFSLGFQLQAYEFAGGVVYNEGVGFSQFDWIDIDGDGVPDSVDATGDGDPMTIFGAGDGMTRAEIDYGDFPVGEVLLDAVFNDDDAIDLPGGQTSVSRSTGLAGGVDFSIYIGPICVVACYLVINPGVHGGYDRQTQQIQMVDMNGDGYTDAVKSTDYEDVEVQLNTRGRTNLLQTVTNPLGGQIRLGYDRIGNTVQNPNSMWVMSSVEVHDGRQGDGDDLQRSRFTYSGATWDPLLREQLGFSSIVEQQLDGSGNVARSYERDYLNGNPSETGTLVEERVYDDLAAGGRRLVQRSRFEWQFVNANPRGKVPGGPQVDYGDPVVNLPPVRDPARVVLFDTALSPRLVTDEVVQFDQYDTDQQVLRTIYTYSVIGDVLTVFETNEDEVEGDDTYTVLTYSDCAARDGDRGSVLTGSWVSVPQTVTVFAGKLSTQRLKFRDGGPDLCGNAVPVRIAELVAEDPTCGTDLYAITELSFDDWGNYDAVVWPSNEVPSCADFPPATVASADLTFEGCSTLSTEDDATRYCVDYEYDPHRFTDVAVVTDNHGVSAEAAYEPRNGRLLSRDDPAGNTTSYTYDAAGRLATLTAPREQGGPTVTMRYGYGGLSSAFDPAGPHAWSTVSIHDVFNAGNDIQTATFVDGAGRVVQRKRDADVDGVAGESRIVEGAVDFDALGRAVKEWYPVVEPQDAAHPLTTYNRENSQSGAAANVPVTQPFVRSYDVFDRMVQQVLPDQSVERIRYEFALLPQYDGGIVMSKVTTTDPLGRAIARWSDVGGAVFRNEDTAAPSNLPSPSVDTLAALPTDGTLVGPRIAPSVSTAPTVTTRYDYDRLGRLVTVIDAAGAVTSHTYDFLDNVTSTDTPDSGLTARTFAPSGQLLTVSRANGTVATYGYDRDRLVRLAYSDDTPNVTYEWGDDGAVENGAGRVVRVRDGVMERTYGYDGAGNVARETATEMPAPFGIVKTDLDTWTTEWVYDSLARIELLTYPDGERLTHDYDRGGRPTRLVSQAPQHDLYDQYGNAVARPDVEIVYVDAVRYDQFGEATYVRTGTGVETRYAFEPTRRFVASVDTDATATTQYDGTLSSARPLQRLRYRYDAVGNVRDATNRLYESAGDTKITDLGPPPVNNVPGPSQAGYTYDGFYRLTAAAATYVDQKELRNYRYVADWDDNGTLVSKHQTTTTVSTTGSTPKRGDSGNGKKGNGSTTAPGATTTQPTCESNTGSGGGSFNQDPETTYVIAEGDMVYAVDDAGADTHRLVRSGFRTHTYDANGNQTGWVENCAKSTGGSSTISRTFEWDAENRLTRIAEGNNDTDLRYTAEGARGLERGPGGTTWFVNEHWRTVNDGHRYANVYLGSQLVASHRTSPQPPAPAPCTDTAEVPCGCSGSTACVVVDVTQCDLANRVFDPATSTCQPKETRTIHFFHKDLQGSLRVATDEVGAVFQYVDYLANGRPWVAGQSTIKDTPYLFGGGWTDTTYDLVNFGDRWYEAREESFLSVEPLLTDDPYAAVNDPWVLSAYNFAASNPLRYVDPDGRAPKTAYNGYSLGGNLLEKHEAGNITISVASREKRPAPAFTFGGRYSNDLNGQDLQRSFQDHKDKADRISTAITIKKEDGVSKVYVFGNKISDSSKPGSGGTDDTPTPSPSPADPGSSDAGPSAAAPKPPSSASAPVANESSSPPSGQSGGTGAPSGGSGATAAPPVAGGGSSSGGNDTPSSSPQPPKPPPGND